MSDRGPVAVLLLAALAAAAGCARPAPPPAGTRVAPPGDVTPAFQGLRTLLVRASTLRAAENAAGLRQTGAEISRHAMGLLASSLPHDLRDGDVERYLDARAAFGESLKRWARAVEGPDDAELFASFDELADAYWAWVDTYKGLPPERSV